MSHLSVAALPPGESPWGALELVVLIDGQDIIEPFFENGPRLDPDRLLGRLVAADDPHEVMLAEADCTYGCCGGIFVRISRHGYEVVWDQWRNPDDSEFTLPPIRFDAAQYDAELARADRERPWEWRGRTVARLLRTALDEQPDILGQWNSLVMWTTSRTADDCVHLSFTSPPPGAGRPCTQLLVKYPVSDAPPEEQCEQIVAALRASDPRRTAASIGNL